MLPLYFNSPQTLDYSTPKESLLEALLRQIREYQPLAPQRTVEVDQYFNPKRIDSADARTWPKERGRMDDFYHSRVKPFVQQNLPWLDIMAQRIPQMINMKSQPAAMPPPAEMMGPPEAPMPVQGPPMPQGLAMPPPPPEQVPQQAPMQQAPMQAIQYPMTQGPPSIEEWMQTIQKMMPPREKTFMDSPWYPISMGLLGLGTHLLTPPYQRGNSSPVAPLIAAIAQQARHKDDRRDIFEKAISSYPAYVQAMQRSMPEMTAIFDEAGNFKGYMPGKHQFQVRRKDEPERNYIRIGDQLIEGPPGKYHFPKIGEDEQDYLTVWNEDSRKMESYPKKPGPVVKQTRTPPVQSYMEKFNKTQGRTVVVRKKGTNTFETISEEEARRRGIRIP